MTIKQILRTHLSGIDALDARILLASVLKKPAEYSITHPEHTIQSAEIKKLKRYGERRRSGEPIAIILRKKEFYGRIFSVNKNTLIPRPETEHMIELGVHAVIQEIKKNNLITIADIGTGSGCIIISLAKEINALPIQKNKRIRYIASDISTKALFVAKKNSKTYTVSKNIRFFLSDLFQNKIFKKELGGKEKSTLCIFANLPYVSKEYLEKKPSLFSRGLSFEPRVALNGGKNGMDIYNRFFRDLMRILSDDKKILCFFEINPEQKSEMERLIKNTFLPMRYKLRFFKDLSGSIRIGLLEISKN